MAELTAAGEYVRYWWPDVPTWLTALVFFVAITGVNLSSVKYYGETEFWFALIKVGAVIAMIVFGGYLLLSGNGGPQASVSNLWRDGGFFPHGVGGLFMTMAVIMFSFGGLELIGMAAAGPRPAENHSQGGEPGDLPRADLLHRLAAGAVVPVSMEQGGRRRPS